MTPERWPEVKRILYQAMELPVAEREVFLEGACGGDSELRGEVESLLQASEQEDVILDTSIVPKRGSAIEPGSRIGDYEVGAKLGEGGMGVVFQAFDAKLGRRVALKVMHAGSQVEAGRREQFLREARAASALNHPNIITIHDFLRHDDADILVMEFVEGDLLSDLLRNGPMELDRVIAVATQIARALEATHAAGVVHRDLKPSNVVVRPDGIVKVLDFGAAELQDAPRAFAGSVVGTPSYMSPEQMNGGMVDPRSDIFSFGSMLYEMVAGRKAFSGSTVTLTAKAVREEEPAPLDSPPPAGLSLLLYQCLRKDPEQRMQTMGDVRKSLQDLKEGLEVARILSQLPEWTSEPGKGSAE
ncbi:MAG: serine/threonine protein kinase [Acidobacteria bacterium]|nr:serine/threonine protein kinase [Acidobacteriota bacterium]